MNYKKPINTIVHEMVHLGMEESIEQSFELEHGTKERIIDRFVFLFFGEQLPAYQVQPMGDEEMDRLLKSTDDFKDLASI